MIRAIKESREINSHASEANKWLLEAEAIKWLLEDESLAFEMMWADLNVNPFRYVEESHEKMDVDEPDPLRAAIICAQQNDIPDFIYFGDWYIHQDFDEFESLVHETMRRQFPSRRYKPEGGPIAYDYQYPPIDFLGFGSFEDLHPKFRQENVGILVEKLEDDADDIRGLSSTLLELSLNVTAHNSGHDGYLNVVQLLSYLFSESDTNPLFHSDEDSFWDNWGEAPGWNQIEELQDAQDEAYERFEMLKFGLKIVNKSEDFVEILMENYRRTYEQIAKLVPTLPKNKQKDPHERYYALKEIIFNGNKQFRRPELNWPAITLPSEQSLTPTQSIYRHLRLWRDSDNEIS
jgi:hypothetical protein